MTPTEPEKLTDHEYDGIREYDNPLPGWWVAILWGTVIFSVFYAVFYHFGSGTTVLEAYNKDMIAFYDMQAANVGEVTAAALLDLSSDPSMMAGAKEIFRSKCSSCHGMFGEGNIGPNLTDRYWIHGADLMNIYHTISEGVPAKGMLAWKRQLRPSELMVMAAYVATLNGSDPPNPKSPQGDLVEATPLELAAEAGEAVPAGAEGAAPGADAEPGPDGGRPAEETPDPPGVEAVSSRS